MKLWVVLLFGVAFCDETRSGRFLNLKSFYPTPVETNEIDAKEEDPNVALSGVYTECVLSFSLPCLQKKFLVFLDKLGRMDGFGIFGDFLAVRRTTKEVGKPITEKSIEARVNGDNDLENLVEYAIDRFFNTHKLQMRLPFGLVVADGVTGRSGDPSSTVDISFPRDVSEGRGKKKKKKKILLLLLLLIKAKALLLLPIALVLIKIKAIKALIIAKIALLLSLSGVLSKLMGRMKGGMMNMMQEKQKVVIIHDPHHATGGHASDTYGPPPSGGGGGGGGWSSGGGGGGGGDSYSNAGGDGGGWGRSWNYYDSHNLAYRGYNSTKGA